MSEYSDYEQEMRDAFTQSELREAAEFLRKMKELGHDPHHTFADGSASGLTGEYQGEVEAVGLSGVIGIGKSTIAKLLKTQENCLVYMEEVGSWTKWPSRNADGSFTGETIDVLDAVCHGPPLRSISQVMILVSNARRQWRAIQEGTALSKKLGRKVYVIIERPARDASIFVEMLSADFNTFDLTAFYDYLGLVEELLNALIPSYPMRKFLITAPGSSKDRVNVYMERIKKRGRTQEQDYTPEYIGGLDDIHLRLLTEHEVVYNNGDPRECAAYIWKKVTGEDVSFGDESMDELLEKLADRPTPESANDAEVTAQTEVEA